MLCTKCGQDKSPEEFYLRRFVQTKLCRTCEDLNIERRRAPEFRQYALEQALFYARRGWKILPMNIPIIVGTSVHCSCGCATPRTGKHPRIRTDESLSYFASTNEATIRQWFRWWPNTNVAIVTSPESGIFGIDVDFSNGGNESMLEFEQRVGSLKERALIAHTSDGYHMYFKHPGVDLPDFHNALPGIDIRAREGFLLAPPSLHQSGIEYKWEEGHEHRELQPLPDGAVDKLTSLLETSQGYIYTSGVLIYPGPGQPIPPGWQPGLKGNVG